MTTNVTVTDAASSNTRAVSAANRDSAELYYQLQPGDRVEVDHVVTIGSSAQWSTRTVGAVVRKERRRHGLHFRRNPDDKVYSDVIILARDDGELTTVTMDEYTKLRQCSAAAASRAGAVPMALHGHELRITWAL